MKTFGIKGKICFCPESINWILHHLQKGARAKFKDMVVFGNIEKITVKTVKKIKKRIKRKMSRSEKIKFINRLNKGRRKKGLKLIKLRN